MITGSSSPVAVSARALARYAVSTIAAIEHMAPEVTNTPRMARLTLIPEKRAASRLLPIAYRARPQCVACRNTPSPMNRTTKMSELHGTGVALIVSNPRFWYHSGKLCTPRSLRMIRAVPR